MDYRVLLAKPAAKQLDEVPASDYERVLARLRALAHDPRPAACAKLEDGCHRIRVGAYRAIYAVEDAARHVIVLRVARRSEKTYRDLPRA